MEQHNRTVVVTGTLSGAGRAIAFAFAANQDNLVITSRRMAALQNWQKNVKKWAVKYCV